MADDKPQLHYAGDLTPTETWEMLKNEPDAVLIDVRTPEEWSFVGTVDLSSLGKEPKYIPWVLYPKMERYPDFLPHLETQVQPKPNTPMLFLCRSGNRSAFAAHVLTAEGYQRCYNILYGFEGDHDDAKHRGQKNGWKVDNLPWTQG